MSLDFQQVREKVRRLGENAAQHAQQLRQLQQEACALLESRAEELEGLRQKVQRVVRSYDPSLRCALPADEKLNAHCPTPALPAEATLLAVDGSQINPDRHAAVQYCLTNLGAIQLRHGSAAPPAATVRCELYYEDSLYTPYGVKTEAELALERDLGERKLLAELAASAQQPVITMTDGPLELWGAKEARSGDESSFTHSLNQYLDTLSELCVLGAVTAGYVDKPGADLVVRLLEIAKLSEQELETVRDRRPLRGVTDSYLFCDLLAPGERSAVFAMQSQSAKSYTGQRALHFFYLNTGRPGHPWVARVEIPRWVAENRGLLDSLHAVLVAQCRALGARPYPYLLHRAHETAVVSLPEKDQVTQMILLELRRRGVTVGEESYKQAAKDLQGRTRM